MVPWTSHHHFAESENSRARENRLTWLKKKDKDEVSQSSSLFQGEQDDPLKPTPEEIAYNLDPLTRGMQREPSSLLQEFTEQSDDQIIPLAQKRRAELLRTAIAQRRPGVGVIQKMIDNPETNPKQFRMKLEEILKPKKKPEEDDALQEAMKATRGKMAEVAENAEGERPPTNWELFWKKINQLGNPLYIRLARFLRNPAVAERNVLSPDKAFEDLCNPEKRLDLFQKLAGMRQELVFQGPRNLEDRQHALEDLFAFLTHGQYLLSPEERTFFYDSFVRVGACVSVLDEYSTSLRLEESGAKETSPDKTLYQGKFEGVGRFFEQDRQSSNRTIDGKNGLLERLERASAGEEGEKNAFGILAEGLREGGWIPPVPDTLRYTCTLIALEEIGYLYMQIASGKMESKDASTLTAHVKMLVLETLRRGISGQRREVPFDIKYLDPRQEFDALEKKIRSTPHPTDEEANELILLYAWLAHRGETPRMDKEELRKIMQRAEMTIEDLQNERVRTRKLLPENIREGSPKQLLLALGETENEQALYASTAWQTSTPLGKYLRTSCTYAQLEGVALSEGKSTVTGWLQSDSAPKTLPDMQLLLEKKHADLLPSGEALAKQREYKANVDVKLKKRLDREAAPLHEMSDRDYVENLKDIRKIAKSEEQERTLTAALNQAYDGENRERQKIHALELSLERTNLLDAIEADIHLEARSMRMTYLHDLLQKVEEIKDVDYDPFNHEINAAGALEVLEHLDLRSAAYPLIESEAALAQLHYLKNTVRQPLKEAQEETEKVRKARSAAAALLADAHVQKNASPETRKMLETCALPDAPIGGAAVKALSFFGTHPEVFIDGQKMHEEQKLYSGEKLSEWDRKKEIVLSEIRSVLESYDPHNAYGLEEYFRSEGRVEKDLAKASPEAIQHLHRLEKFAAVLKKFENILKKTPEKGVFEELPEEQFAEKTSLPKEKWAGIVRKREGQECIYLNATRLAEHPQARTAILLEEQLHVLNYAMSRYITPTFFPDVYDILEREGGQLFRTASKQWIERPHGMTNRDFRRDSADEFWAKRRVYYAFGGNQGKLNTKAEREGRGVFTLIQEDIDLFNDLDERGVIPVPREVETRFSQPEREEEKYEAVLAASGDTATLDDDFLAGFEGEESAGASSHAESEGGNAGENLRLCKQAKIKVDAFITTYPDHGPHSAENRAVVAELVKDYEEANEEFLQKKHPEGDPAFENRVKALEKDFGGILKVIDKFDMIREDLRNEPPKTRGIKAIWKNVQWVSFFDIARMFKDIAEDIKRQHNRRQEGKVGRIGESVTHWIPSWVPYLGNLHHDFHDRKQKAEIEEVDHFKKALENVDAFELQDMARHTKNKDHLKAVIILLTERGRMNWNDQDFWRNLNDLSIYKMPVDECARNENLREAWLRKIISDIWEDRDNYRSWKGKNESTFSEKMKNYTPETDRLSNLKGGLAGELEKQLRVYTEFKEKKKHGPMDEAIRPHLYNEIIDYSIRNGKMSMEEKFFYLVQGLSCGLLTMDRLRILAGEGAAGGEGVLNTFPFIDYFYGRNNTKAEIDALAKRLRESTKWEDDKYYRPGLKTTLWLELEVSREDSVRKRLSKGMSKKGGETDHDDMHFFMPRIDYKMIAQLATPQGGGRPQLSPEAWENAYSGYNSFFKSLGFLAKLEEENMGERFTTKDAEQIVQAVAGFVRMDSTMTNRSALDQRQSGLSWLRMKTNKSVVGSDGSKTVYQERQTVEDFIRDLLTEVGYPPADMEDLLYSTEHTGQIPEKAGRIKKLSDDLESTLLQKVTQPGGFDIMKRVLKKHMHLFSSHAGEDYNYEKVKELKKLAKAEAQAPAAASPAHH